MPEICVRDSVTASESYTRGPLRTRSVPPSSPGPWTLFHLSANRTNTFISQPFSFSRPPLVQLADFAFADAYRIDSYSRERMEMIAGPAADRLRLLESKCRFVDGENAFDASLFIGHSNCHTAARSAAF